jgi:hypothetical protein
MNGLFDWLVKLPAGAIASIVVLILVSLAAGGIFVTARLIDKSEPGPQRALVPEPPPDPGAPSLTAVSPYADVFFPTADRTDEIRAVGVPGPRNGAHRANGSRHAVMDEAPPWAAAPEPGRLN